MVTTIDTIRDEFEGPSMQSEQRFAPATAHALARLRLRWLWLAMLANIGAALAYAVVLHGVDYKSTATVRLSDAGPDSSRVEQIAQTVTNTALSSNVVTAAADTRGVTVADLGSRLSVQWKSDTDIVEIVVRGKNAQNVPRETSAVVDSLLAYYDSQRQSQIEELRRVGNQLLSQGSLADPRAEDARRSGIGSAIASRQGDAASSGTTVTPLEPAGRATRATMSGSVAAGLGALIGFALASTLALAIPFRRRKVTRSADASALLGGVPVLEATDVAVAETAGRFLESERSDLVVVASGTALQEAQKWSASVHAVLRAHGMSVALIDDVAPEEVDDRLSTWGATHGPRAGATTPDPEFSGFLALGRAGRLERREQRGVSSLILLTPDAPQALSLLAGQTEISSIVIARRGHSRIHELQRVCEALRYSDPTVVLVK